MEPTDPNTGVPMYDPCHMYTGTDYSACFANGGSLPVPDTTTVVTHWYSQTWVPPTIALLVAIVGIVGYIAYTRRTAK